MWEEGGVDEEIARLRKEIAFLRGGEALGCELDAKIEREREQLKELRQLSIAGKEAKVTGVVGLGNPEVLELLITKTLEQIAVGRTGFEADVVVFREMAALAAEGRIPSGSADVMALKFDPMFILLMLMLAAEEKDVIKARLQEHYPLVSFEALMSGARDNHGTIYESYTRAQLSQTWLRVHLAAELCAAEPAMTRATKMSPQTASSPSPSLSIATLVSRESTDDWKEFFLHNESEPTTNIKGLSMKGPAIRALYKSLEILSEDPRGKATRAKLNLTDCEFDSDACEILNGKLPQLLTHIALTGCKFPPEYAVSFAFKGFLNPPERLTESLGRAISWRTCTIPIASGVSRCWSTWPKDTPAQRSFVRPP